VAARWGTGRTAWPWPGGGRPCCGRSVTPAGSPRPRPGCCSSPRWAASSSTCPTPPSWEGVDWGDWAPRPELGRLLWHERDTLLQELIGLPPGQVDLAGFARRFGVLVAHRWPSILTVADPAEWRQALWSTALAPLAMLGALDIPARLSPSPAWFALTGTAPALVAAAAAMSGPEPPASLAAATTN
jgi:hypothetical protein